MSDDKKQKTSSIAQLTKSFGDVAYTMNERAVKKGDILGESYKIPDELERLNGWNLYNITQSGVPQAREPQDIALNGGVSYEDLLVHKQDVQKLGNINARVLNCDDSNAMFGATNSIVANCTESFKDVVICWLNDSLDHCHSDFSRTVTPQGGTKSWLRKDCEAFGVIVQDIPELRRNN